MKYTHIIFDMDGTLVDTSAYTIRACRAASAELDLPVPSDEVIKAGIGYASEEFYRRILPGVAEDARDAYGQRVHELEEEGIRTLGPSILFPGVDAMLQVLAAGGATLMIASTGEREYVELALAHAGVRTLFAGVSAGEPRKEEMARRIRAQAPEGQWAFVGDRFKDADAARAAEIPSFFAGWGFSPQEESCLFDHRAATPGELLKMLGY